MCRLFAVTSDKPLSPMVAIKEARERGYKNPVCFKLDDKPLVLMGQTATAQC